MAEWEFLDEYDDIEVGTDFGLEITNGFYYIINVTQDPKEKPDRKQEEYEGKKTWKNNWEIKYLGIEVQDQDDVDYLAKKKEDKFKRISDREENTDTILKLTDIQSKQFSEFLKENKCNRKSKISFYRDGSGKSTKYHFDVVT